MYEKAPELPECLSLLDFLGKNLEDSNSNLEQDMILGLFPTRQDDNQIVNYSEYLDMNRVFWRQTRMSKSMMSNIWWAESIK